MIKRVVHKRKISDRQVFDDLNYWKSCSYEERISAVEILRRQYYGGSGRLQRISQVIKRS